MILVAFVLVLVATVTLILGSFFFTETNVWIYISMASAVATLAVIVASIVSRRRAADQPEARPEPLGSSDERRPAPLQADGPRATTLGDGADVPALPEEAAGVDQAEEADEAVPATAGATAAGEQGDVAADDEPTVTIVSRAPQAEDEQVDAPTPAEEEPAPAPRRVAPRRVVRRSAAATSGAPEPAAASEPGATEPEATPAEVEQPEPATEAPAAAEPAQPEPPTPAPAPAPAPAEPETTPEPAAATGSASTQKRTTRRVVRRTAASASAGSGTTTRKVVRRSSEGGGQQRTVRRVRRPAASGSTTEGTAQRRTVRRVVRRAPDTEGSGGADATASGGPSSSGTRGKQAREVLSMIKGVGPAKQDALLKRYGSLEEIAAADVAELTAVRGVGESIAEQIKRTLSER